MNAPSRITPELVAAHGLKPDEYQRALDLIGREPTLTELGIFSAMWNEHCSYKSSKKWLRTLPTSGPRVIQGPGENAGVVDIGDGLAVVFKMESHNHPSFIEPYQGAATGVGGILRDVFTMGARPVAALNALRFGEPEHPKTRHLVSGVVAGIGGYGNSFGVPTVGGEVNFHRGYNGNILVNAFAAGIARTDAIFYSKASGVGLPVVYLGSKTGRDGIHGASMASAEFDDDSAREAADGAGRRSLRREAPARGLPRADGERRGGRDPGHGRRRPHLLGGRDGRQGRPRHRARPRQGALPRDRHDRLRDDAVGEPGADADGAPPGDGGGGRGDLPEMGARLRRRRPHHRRPPLPRPPQGQGRGRPADQGPRRPGAGIRPALRAPERPAAARRNDSGTNGLRRGPDSDSERAGHVLAPLGLGAVRPPDRRQHRAAARRRRGRGPGRRHAKGPRLLARRDAALLRRRSLRGRQAGGGRMLAEPDRGRRRAACRHRQPQLRQSRAAGDHGRTGRRDPRHLARPAAPSPSRSSPATSRSTTRPTARRSRRRRRSAASASSPTSSRWRRSPSRPRAR